MTEDLKYKRLVEFLWRDYKENYHNQQGRLAKDIGISQGTLSKILNRTITDPKIETRLKIAKHLKIDYDYDLDHNPRMRAHNEGLTVTIQPQENNIIRFKTETERKHFEVIRRFEDPEHALMLNEYLVELEALDVQAYEQIVSDVRGKVRDIKRKKKEEEMKKDHPPKKASSDPE